MSALIRGVGAGHDTTVEAVRQFILDNKVEQPNGCWYVPGKTDSYGYQVLRPGLYIGTQTVHRLAYRVFVGPIPDGLQVDHTCHNEDAMCPGGPACGHRRCCNPEHLEAVTSRQNTLRGKGSAAQNAAKTACPRGHGPFAVRRTHDRTYRYCAECQRQSTRESSRRSRKGTCPLCDRSYQQIARHMRRMHPDYDPALCAEFGRNLSPTVTDDRSVIPSVDHAQPQHNRPSENTLPVTEDC